jgi:hypothetical protein
MEDPGDSRKEEADLRVLLRAALHVRAVPEALDALTRMAAIMIKRDQKGEAVEVLAYVMQHPDVKHDTYDRADDLFMALEGELGQSVISDAKDNARYRTLRAVVEGVLGGGEAKEG